MSKKELAEVRAKNHEIAAKAFSVGGWRMVYTTEVLLRLMRFVWGPCKQAEETGEFCEECRRKRARELLEISQRLPRVLPGVDEHGVDHVIKELRAQLESDVNLMAEFVGEIPYRSQSVSLGGFSAVNYTMLFQRLAVQLLEQFGIERLLQDSVAGDEGDSSPPAENLEAWDSNLTPVYAWTVQQLEPEGRIEWELLRNELRIEWSQLVPVTPDTTPGDGKQIDVETRVVKDEADNIFRKENDTWQFRWQGGELISGVKHTKYYSDIQCLLSQPEVFVPLRNLPSNLPKGGPTVSKAAANDAGLSDGQGQLPTQDDIDSYRAMIRSQESVLKDPMSTDRQKADAREAISHAKRELKPIEGLSGKSRPKESNEEANTRIGIRRAYVAIRKRSPALSEHLAMNIGYDKSEKKYVYGSRDEDWDTHNIGNSREHK